MTSAEATAERGSRLLGGGAALLLGTGLANIGNYLFNLVLGRWLGPALFAQLNAVVMLSLAAALLTQMLQMLAARYAARYAAAPGQAALAGLAGLRRWLLAWAWRLGAALGIACAAGAGLLARFFHTGSPWPFVILGLGLPCYLAQAVERGVLQGQTRFAMLALSYQAEMWARLAIALALVALGWAVNGAVAAIALSFVATWLVARRAARRLPPAEALSAGRRRAIARYALPVGAALAGQALINYSDVAVVAHFFAAEEAGWYGALALIGRIVFFASWTLVAALFPLAARRQRHGQPHRWLLSLALAGVALIAALALAAMLAAPEAIVRGLFGAPFVAVAPLLAHYTGATALYALANVIASYRLALGQRTGGYLMLLGGLAQAALLYARHETLRQVVLWQLALMAGLLVLLLAWDAWRLTQAGEARAYGQSAERR